MRNIFELTKGEQRIVIIIVTALVAIAFVKHYWQNKSSLAPVKSISTPVASPRIPPPEGEEAAKR